MVYEPGIVVEVRAHPFKPGNEIVVATGRYGGCTSVEKGACNWFIRCIERLKQQHERQWP